MIHQYKNKGLNIVLDVNSGSIHVMDEIAYYIVEQLDKNPDLSISDSMDSQILESVREKYPDVDEDDIRGAYVEIVGLIKNGELFTEDEYEDRIKGFKHDSVVKALCLHVSHDCNLACKYCFAGEGEYHGKRELMSYETGKKALDFLVEASKGRRNLEVDFFGGEPLMNFEVVKKLVAYGRSIEKEKNKNFRFTLTTNGLLLDDDVIEFANKEFDNVVLSLDGRKDINDNMRPTRAGTSSYDVILPKFKKFVSKRGDKQYYIRGTYTRNNLDFSKDVLHMVENGFDKVSVEPVVAEPSEPYALRTGDIPVLKEQYDILADHAKDFTFFHFMIDLEGGPCVYKRLSGCGSGTEYLAVTPSGDLYPCHQFVGEEDFLMGNVNDGVTNIELRDMFSSCNVYSRKECRDCFAKFYCSGGCAANSWHFNKDLNGVYPIGCELEKKRVENAILLQVQKAMEINE